MWKLIIAFEGSDVWSVSQHHTQEDAITNRERFLRAQRHADINDEADRNQGRKRKQAPARRQVRWTAIALER